MNECTDPGTQKELRQGIDALINQHAGEIERLQARATGAVADLKSFESLTQEDQKTLSIRSTAVHDKLVAERGSLKDLDAEIEKYRKEMSAEMDECERGEPVITY